ncbi:MAG TPA: PqqD family protein [Smithellaceae bacterium]|nr:PqqD family protein [Smithellaceae bacterium]HRS82843.1 PqqD family protein [Smithellaceae bacterium]HRV44737.1 PqqD family protein [Smithellaceae bacterium]
MNPLKKAQEKTIRCVFTGGQKKNCPPVKNAGFPLCEKHKRELNRLTRCRIDDDIRGNYMEKGDESIIFNPKNGGVYSLNATGTFIFKAILAGKTFCEILAESQSRFDVENISEMVADYRLFVEELKKSSVITAEEV